MITDIEMEAMGLLKELCGIKVAKNVLDVATDMLGDLDSDKFYRMTDEEKEKFLNPFANKIDSIRIEVRETFVPVKYTAHGMMLEQKFAELEAKETNKEAYDGTWVLEKYIRTVEDAAGWCLLTYGGEDAIAVVNEWIQDGKTKPWGFNVFELKNELEKCFEPNQERIGSLSELISNAQKRSSVLGELSDQPFCKELEQLPER